MLTDKELISKIQHGDINAFSDFVDDLKDKAFSLTLGILKNTEEAEDSLQEAFIKTYRAIVENKFKGDSKLSTYFYTIVYNTAVDSFKKSRRKNFSMISIDVEDVSFKEGDELTVSPDSLISEESFDKKISDNEIQSIVKNYLNKIPVQYSLILILFYVDGLSHEEISNLLGLPVGTVKNRLFRAKEKIKEIILSKIPEHEILNFLQ
ncbi:sigma-70 family RNA polymerase sigma factor [Ignavibacteria bacterium CHB1]|nr:MAG: sigma-70 family RNA polymerase sigma factor [Chlorobiota bacterium]MBV6398206.1 ECF RNA polymerase sigma factor SigW [Ignavibacteria bacterium]MCC6885881.1 sigma-70 family RNA polymerase sigma factor [Ignavibacteriales bacterium]MCE7953462.1 sigma-70 family RNA polymerase sigma factor [Chlorobi bacterium CHB7]MDL1887398.1 sigma-70 family RNA polymerase sigma factor [Ignavibacteria bacterium CHB1]RIK48673.1 MAG: hypothetical protein DCC60_06420 [Ignavibacteriota bacterium]